MKFDYDAKYFNPTHTLDCGQVFRFRPFKDGYLTLSADKICYVHSDGVKTIIESDDTDYFYNYFDLARDYSPIIEKAKSYGIPLLSKSAELLSGLKILNQNREEMFYSFIISQNNNIPRIKGIIERICEGLGERKSSPYGDYYAFPSSAALAAAPVEFFRGAGAGYRDTYLYETSKLITPELLKSFEGLSAAELKKRLLKYKGVGGKVADCIALFGFGKTDSFPVDTWLEKVYAEDFHGTLKDRNKITEYFVNEFGEYSGFIQQYLFYGKRLNL